MQTQPLEFVGDATGVMQPPSSPREAALAQTDNHTEPRRILLATTSQLASTARLVMEFTSAGASVSLIAPRHHPARVLDCLAAARTYRAATPITSLTAALTELRPDLVIPCDERTVRDLHTICRETQDPWLRKLVTDCTAPPGNHMIVTSRAQLLALAATQGIRVPPSEALPDMRALQRWMEMQSTPWVMKADGSSSGFGVRIINDPAEAELAFAQLSRPASLRFALRESIMDSNHFSYRPWFHHEKPALSAQGFIDGWPANIGVACWRGEVLASTCAEAVATETATGPSTVSRIIHNAEMTEAARRIVGTLSLSGLIGFDFMIEAATWAAYLIEMNPRSTPICALRLGSGRDLTEALLARRAGRPPRERTPRTERDIVVAFPETWTLDPSNTFLRDGFHDVPWEQPALVRRLMRPERRERYWIFRALRRVLRRSQG